MVLVGDKKYACETCIKGHRSSNCKHVDRPLYEIKKKGRPVTQCDHCRELRKTKQVHVKCVCEVKPTEASADTTPPPGITGPRKGSKKVPASAAFPSGLPEALGASAASMPRSESSDSEYEVHASTCTCKTIGVCNCAMPRVSSSRSKKAVKSRALVNEVQNNEPVMAQPAALVASANSGRNRPVLPRPSPSSHSRSSPPRSVQNPTGAPHLRLQAHFSPYERAYEYAHGADVGAELSMPYPQSSSDQYPRMPSRDFDPRPVNPNLDIPRNADDFATFMNSWLANVQPTLPPSEVPPITCDCGPNCSCPGCIIHRGASAVPRGFESCVNPSTCTSCMDCTILTAIDNSPAFEEWFRRFVPAPGDPNPSIPTSTPPPQFNATPGQHNSQGVQQFDPSMWQSYALWPNLQDQLSGPPPPEDGPTICCAGQCKCPSGMCSCPADCCGCCSGCSCPTCEHEDRSLGMGSGKTITFAVSGERAPCCGGERRSTAPGFSQQAGPSTTGPSTQSQDEINFADGRALDLRGVYEEWSAPGSSTMEVPRVSLSRASSSSSRSSSEHSHRSSSRGLAPSPVSRNGDCGIGACCTSMQTLSTSRPGSHYSGSDSNSPIPPSYTPSHTEQLSGAPFDIDDGSPRIF